MSGLLGAVYSYGDSAKRKLRGLLQDPLGTIGLGVARFGEDQQQMLDLANEAGYMPGSRSVLVGDKQRALARALLAKQATEAGAGMLGSMKAVGKFKYPQQEALETAQRNAAKPVSEGGLGLPANNTPMDRARALGFETAPSKTIYHGARGEISGPIDPSRSDFGFHTGSIDQAEHRLKAFANSTEIFPEGANVLPISKSKYSNMLRVKDEGSFHADALAPQLAKRGIVSKEWAKKAVQDIGGDWKKAAEYDALIRRSMGENGFHGISYSNAQEGAGASHAFSDPSVLRSRFAAFDPARINENNLLAGAVPFTYLADEDRRNRLAELLRGAP